MRIRELTLRNVRGVEERTLVFDDGVTVVVGPNEVGKSTIAEALDLLLEYKDSSQAQAVKDVRPVHRDADPEVELRCTTGGYELTYRKVWSGSARARATELTVAGRAAERHTGDEAHERVLELLAETMDEQLWAALRVQQRRDVGQADLADSEALAAALDAAAGDGEGGAAEPEDGSIVARVEEAAGEFWTDTGRERAPLKDADAAVVDAEQRLAAVRERLDRVQQDVETQERLAGQLASWERDLPGLEQRERETAEAVSALAGLREAVTEAERDLATARAAGTEARRAAEQRAELVEALAAATATRDAARERTSAADARAEEARDALATAGERREEARAAVRAARTAVTRTERDRDRLRAAAELGPVRERLEAARRLVARRGEATTTLEREAPDDAAVRRLEQLDGELRRAEAVRDAGVGQLRLSADAATEVVLDDDRLTVGPDAVTRDLGHVRTVEVAGVRIEVAPGTSADELVRAADEAQRALDDALGALGVADLAAARDAAERARGAERVLRETAEEWGALVEQGGTEGIETRLRRLEAQAAGQDGAAADPEPDAAPDAVAVEPPRDVEEAEARRAAAAESLEEASTALEEAQELVEQHNAQVTAAATDAAEARATLTGATERVAELEQRLGQARAATPDEQLEDAVTAADQRVAGAAAAEQAARAALDGADAAGREAEHESAAARLASVRQQAADARTARAELAGRIDAIASEGLGEELVALESAVDDARARRDAVRRRADALALLRDTLVRHRDEARARYVAPLRERIESIGRIVFGDGFAVRLDDRLRIVERTMAGITLPVGSLSGGAQEQLAIITRLAVAGLVDTEDGVPLVLDDTLGYADPQRTDRVNSLLARVGADAQVIVLTCHPDRFTGIRGARVVQLP